MATIEMTDAPKGIDTTNVMSVGDVFEGSLDANSDKDWIKVELVGGTTYEISLTGDKDVSASTKDAAGKEIPEANGVDDTILMILDSKGGHIVTNDDINPAGDGDNPTNLNSELKFAAPVTGTYYIKAGAYEGNQFADNTGTYKITVTELEVMDPNVGDPIVGTNNADKLVGTDKGEEISGMEGNDTLEGGAGGDTLSGGTGNDLLVGGPGGDTLMGGDGKDTISYAGSAAGVTINLLSGTARDGDATGDTIGTEGADGKVVNDVEHVEGSMYDDALTGDDEDNSLWGLAGADVLSGGKGEDTLEGGAGADELDGGEGDDTLEGGAGADELTGGDGNDTASYARSAMGVTVRLHTSQSMGGDAEGDTFGGMVEVSYMNEDKDDLTEMRPDILNLTGSANDDILAGDRRDNTLKGGAGNDKLYGGPGDADDGQRNMDILEGGAGNDWLYGGLGDDTLSGGAGDDTLSGGPGKDTFMGGAGDDMIYADAADKIGNIGNTDIGGEGTDTLSYERLEKSPGPIKLYETGIENIIGSQGDDTLEGDKMNNIIEGGEGGDILDGGGDANDGNDTLSYRSSDTWVRVTLNNTGAAAIATRGHASGDKATNFESITGSAYADDLTGNDGNNVLQGLAGDDELTGGKGDDTLEGGAGEDILNGDVDKPSESDGSDTLSYESSNAGVRVNLAAAIASGGHASGDTIETVEEADPYSDDANDKIEVSTFENITGSMHDDDLTGDHRNNTLEGGDGADTLDGGKGNDILTGGNGNDTLRGGAGKDMLKGGANADVLDGGEDEGEDDEGMITADDGKKSIASVDTVSYSGATEGVTVNLDTSKGTGGDAEGDTLRNIEKVEGSMHDDTFVASAGADVIYGGEGVKGDTVSYEASESEVKVTLVKSSMATIGVGGEGNSAIGDKLTGIENLTGSAHNDILTGDGDNNTLRGGAGKDILKGGLGKDALEGGDGRDDLFGGEQNDTLTGGKGDDTLTGDGGSDTFVFSPDDGDGDDYIVDFGGQDGNDKDQIDLSAFESLQGIDADEFVEFKEGSISQRGGAAVIDLSDHGGGKITLQGTTAADMVMGDFDFIA